VHDLIVTKDYVNSKYTR